MAPLLAAGHDIHSLLVALRSGPIDAVGAGQLLRARRPHLLLGLPETAWLEAKRQPYNLDEPRDGIAAKVELAQDVARFANGDVHAVLAIGIETTERDGLDTLDSIRPAKLSALSPQR